MSLPNGYKRLKYIQSSGTQYVDSRFKPNNNSRVVLDFEPTAAYSSIVSIFGIRDENSGTAANMFVFWNNGKNTFRTDYFGTQKTMTVSTLLARQTVDKDKNVTTIGSVSVSNAAATGQCSNNLYLFCANSAGTANYFSRFKLYSCQIYDNGTLVRDYIPCQTAAGEIGLWDDVNSVFYGNSGAGTFTAGPEVLEGPPMPSGFVASFLTETTVQLIWSVSGNATGYKLYKNGVLLSTLTDTSYTDTVQVFSGTLYAVTAYNDYGESAAAELTYCSIPENPILYLVTDRTESDVAYAKLLSGKGMGGMSDAEKAKWLLGLKGSYNALDLNRVESAVDYVARRLQSFGNAVEVHTKKGWTTKDVPNVSAMKRYLDDVAALRAVLAVLPTTPEVPPDMDGLTYTEANNIEQILLDIDALLTNIAAGWLYSGEIYSGGGFDFMQDRVSMYPGRVKLIPVSGQENTYDMIRADEPTQEGTPLNKATFLKDETAELFGLGSDAVPDDVLNLLSNAAFYKTATQTAQLNTLEAGDVIYLNESGKPVPYIVVNQGIPQDSTLYDSSCNGTWVLRKDVYSNAVWDAENSNVLPGSDIFNTLSGLLSLYDSDVQSAIKTVKVPYCIGGSSSTIMSGANGLSCKIFPLSAYECGITTSQGTYPIDGALLDYFLLGVDSEANKKRISYFNSSPAEWWTRSPITNSSKICAAFDTYGRQAPGSSNGSKGLRPAFILDPTLVVVTKLPTTGLFDVKNNLIQQLPTAQIATGSYVGTGKSGSGNPNSLTFDFAPKFVMVYSTSSNDVVGPYSVGFYYMFVWGHGMKNTRVHYASNNSTTVVFSQSGNTLSWYSDGSSNGSVSQLNETNKVYNYIALG